MPCARRALAPGLPIAQGKELIPHAVAPLPGIEGDLVSRVSEVIDREVALPDLLAELTTTQVHLSPRLPTGCRFWFRAGSTGRTVFVTEQAPMRRTIEYHASRRSDGEPTSHRIALPYVVFVVSTYGEQIEGLATYFRSAPLRSIDDGLSARPCRTRATMASSVSARSGSAAPPSANAWTR